MRPKIVNVDSESRPVDAGEPAEEPERDDGEALDTLLNIIGIGESAEPTDIANH